MRLGLVVNPLAGVGGKVAHKGSDDPEIVAVARARGAEAFAAGRVYDVPSTIDDPTALAEIEAAIGRWVRVSSS